MVDKKQQIEMETSRVQSVLGKWPQYLNMHIITLPRICVTPTDVTGLRKRRTCDIA